jgi:hypothetical protein
MQPLDEAFMGPLKTFYCQEIEKWLHSHLGWVVTIYQISELFGNAYKRAATGEIAANGFWTTGLFPYDKNIYRPYDFPLSTEDKDAIIVTYIFINGFHFDELCNNTYHCSSIKCCKAWSNAFFMVVEVHVRYLAFSGGDGQKNFIVTRGIQHIPVPPCSQGWEYCGVKACTKADGNCGVHLEVLRKFFLVMSCILHVVNASWWTNLTDVCFICHGS